MINRRTKKKEVQEWESTQYRMGEEAREEEGTEVEAKGKEAVEVDNKAEVAMAAHRDLNILQTRVVKGGSIIPRTTLTSRMAREDPNIIPRTISRLDREVQGTRTTWVVGAHLGTKDQLTTLKVAEATLEPEAVGL